MKSLKMVNAALTGKDKITSIPVSLLYVEKVLAKEFEQDLWTLFSKHHSRHVYPDNT